MEIVLPAIVIIFSVLVAIGFPVVIGYVILKPYQRFVKGKKLHTQFMLTDFFWLFVQLQLALGFVVSQAKQMHGGYFAAILGFITFAVIGMWCGAVAALSRAGIRQTLRRGVFILVLVPGVVFLMMGTAIAFLGTIFGLVGIRSSQGVFGTATSVNGGIQAAAVLVIACASAVLFSWMLRRLTKWLIRTSEPKVASS